MNIIKLDNREFFIINKITYQNNNYLYVISTDGKNDFTILNEYEKNNKKYVKSVTDKNLLDKLFYLIAIENKGDQNEWIRNIRKSNIICKLNQLI